jgi:YfiR/HmsC-like
MGPVTERRRRGWPGYLLRNAVLVLFALAALATCAAGHADAQIGEYQVKAAFLLNFTKFVEWPASAFEDASSPLTICVLGEDPFDGILDQVTAGETVNGRKVVVQRIRRTPKPKSCQVLFIGRSEKDVAGILADVGPGVLTVGEADNFLHDGGIIAFVLQGRHVRFDINQRAAGNAQLTLSARLLSVARSVQR